MTLSSPKVFLSDRQRTIFARGLAQVSTKVLGTAYIEWPPTAPCNYLARLCSVRPLDARTGGVATPGEQSAMTGQDARRPPHIGG